MNEIKIESNYTIDELYLRHEKLLAFTKRVSNQSCCNVCNCISCMAEKVLREIGEEK